ncbi:hypothetical protein K435DRAFT_762112 [Dendrothele bispora CBS 962.96]|uniref:Carbohydrate-binding module family 50 protein n=1 Tax=Dendrothele bispora (strain CBS 962.96) TaxID=1314807 RepID=A0A4S8LGS5_DENBC|nr:hypothetical protein K435DRAFT_737740 [Dendrothele bispora CBS 962.96]THU88111.1 hypothetical protein K435DRAFT_762112 [Dendrothele bispora CBS 962.96]
MGRWTQSTEDSCRLPEGFRRIGYDSDTERYIFEDRNGQRYYSAPGSEYGKLTPAADCMNTFDARRPKLNLPNTGTPVSSFHDILPATLITSPPSMSPSSSPGADLRNRPSQMFRDAAQRATAPKMFGVVKGLGRSLTSARKPRKDDDEATKALLRSQTVPKRMPSPFTTSE